MEDKILTLYAKGMTTRDIEDAVHELYGVTISHTLIAEVTDAVLDEARAWQNRPLDAIYPIVWLDGIVLKVRSGKQVVNKSAHVVLGVNLRGEKEVLGLWLAENEGAKFWLSVLTELKHRGVEDIYVACMDGLKGLPDAVRAAFPKTLTQLCIVHLVRASLRHVDAGDAKAVVAGLKRIYQSASAEEAAAELDAFDAAWARKYRSVVRMWRDNWGNIIAFFQFLPEVRTVIYTTNAIESLNNEPAQTHAQPPHLPQRRVCAKVAVPGNPGSLEKLEHHPSLETCPAELPADVPRRPHATQGHVKNRPDTVHFTDPACQGWAGIFATQGLGQSPSCRATVFQ